MISWRKKSSTAARIPFLSDEPLADTLSEVSAVLLMGGEDMDPSRYGARIDMATQPTDPAAMSLNFD